MLLDDCLSCNVCEARATFLTVSSAHRHDLEHMYGMCSSGSVGLSLNPRCIGSLARQVGQGILNICYGQRPLLPKSCTEGHVPSQGRWSCS